MIQTPIALIGFNRPEKTKMVFDVIAGSKPQKLFLIFDGPRSDHPEDLEKCKAARAVVERVDWDCEVFKKYSDTNLDCGVGPAQGTDWVFKNTDRAIILEDDCVPDPSFFKFCDELLNKYENDTRIVQISGQNYQLGRKPSNYSYYFSNFNICHGAFATWKRAWMKYDYEIRLWPELRDSGFLEDIVQNSAASQYWWNIFEKTYLNPDQKHYWDHQWTFCCWSQNGLSILPSIPLVTNIGHDSEATHTKDTNAMIANLESREMPFPLDHPPYVFRNRTADQFFLENVVLPSLSMGTRKRKPLIRRLAAAIKRQFS